MCGSIVCYWSLRAEEDRREIEREKEGRGRRAEGVMVCVCVGGGGGTKTLLLANKIKMCHFFKK